ncbi:hypothetical protein NGB58_27850, partial [Escherichia coli]|nr:hypothetical protein [Escherichia coli]
PVTTTIRPESQFWNKTAHVELVAKGIKGLETKVSTSPFYIRESEPKDIWYGLVIRSQALAVYNNGLEDIRCRGTWLDQETYIWV